MVRKKDFLVLNSMLMRRPLLRKISKNRGKLKVIQKLIICN